MIANKFSDEYAVCLVVYAVCLLETNAASNVTVLRTSLLSNDYFPHWKLELAINGPSLGRDHGEGATSTWYLTAHYRLISWRRRWRYQVSSYPITNLQIHGIAISQTPILEVLSPSPRRSERKLLQWFTFEESMDGPLCEETELPIIPSLQRPRFECYIIDILKKHSSKSFHSILLSSAEWNDIPESIRSSLVSLIQLPTITYLDIDIIGFPAAALSGCNNLMFLS